MRQRTFATILLAQLWASAAWAQAVPEASSSAAASADEGAPQEIIVTAQKRAERLQDVPIAVNAATGQQLVNSGIQEMQQLNALVPGLNVTTTIGTFIPSLRGITTGSNVVENPVALYIDGVYLPNQREGMRDLADIEQITVLKGPQGTLFGRNATAGVIQITTRRPSFDPQGEFKLGYGSYQTVRGSAYLTGGLSETVAASVTASYTAQGKGWGKSLTAGFDTYKVEHNTALRGKLLFTLDDATEITLIGDYIDREDSGANYQPYPGTIFSIPGFGPVSNRYDTYAGTAGSSTFKGGGVSLQIDHEFDFAKLVSISSYRHGKGGFSFDFLNVAAPLIISSGKVPSENYTQELQLISPSGGAIQWVAGVFYYHNELGYDPFYRDFSGTLAALPTSTKRLATDAHETTESIAPFAQADFEVAPGTKLTVGGRWTYEKRSIRGGDTITRVNGTTAFIPSALINSATIKKPTWRVAIAHKITPDVSIYASYNRGIKSGGFNIATASTPAYLPETLDDWEAGLKTQLFDRRVTLNAGGFYYKYKNLQVITFINGLSPTTTNGARAELYGLDVDFKARLGDDVELSGGFEYLHTKFSSYPNASISTPRPTGGVLIQPGSATGNRLPLAQEFVGTIAFDYSKPVGNVNTHFNLTGTYNSDYFMEPDNYLRQPSYVMLNSSFRISDSDDKYSLTFAASNILNKAVIARNITNAIGYLINYGFAPRTYSVTAGIKF